MTLEQPRVALGDWQLERYRLGELPEDEAVQVREALERDDRLRARLAELEQSDAEILARHPPPMVSAAIRARLSGEAAGGARNTASNMLVPRPALAVAASIVLAAAAAVVLAPRQQGPPIPPDVTRVKGLAPRLVLFRKAGPSRAEPLPAGSAARENDVIQLAYQAVGRRFGVIVSIDGRGAVTRHLPTVGSQAAALEKNGAMPLAQAYQLDDAPGFEEFYLVTADEPFPIETVLAAVRRRHAGFPATKPTDGRLDLPESFDQSIVVLRKEPNR